jgi:hypothetical protein
MRGAGLDYVVAKAGTTDDTADRNDAEINI